MDDATVEFRDPDTGEVEDITPDGSASECYHEVDPAYDYDDASETWVGEPARTELRIETVGGQAKRYLLVEPDDEGVDACVHAMLTDDERAFCASVVDQPELTAGHWRRGHTGRERKLLFDHCYAWIRFGDFVTMQNIANE